MGKSRVLVIGARGYIGKYITKASARLGHPTFILVRPATLDSSKKELLDSFTAAGITILHGDIGDKESIVAALKQVDVVISALGMPQLSDQLDLIKAIKEVGHIKRFLPSEFGTDVERVAKKEAVQSVFRPKVEIRNAVREAGIPYTFVNSNGFIAYAVSLLFKENLQVPPSDKVTIYGDGNVKAIFVAEDDVAVTTIKAIDDPRTLNKQLVIRPKTNILSLHDLVELFEKKIGHNLEKNYIPESVIEAQLHELPFPDVILPAMAFSAFVKGDSLFELGPEDVQATELYPDLEFTTFSSVLDTIV